MFKNENYCKILSSEITFLKSNYGRNNVINKDGDNSRFGSIHTLNILFNSAANIYSETSVIRTLVGPPAVQITEK